MRIKIMLHTSTPHNKCMYAKFQANRVRNVEVVRVTRYERTDGQTNQPTTRPPDQPTNQHTDSYISPLKLCSLGYKTLSSSIIIFRIMFMKCTQIGSITLQSVILQAV